MPIYWAVLTIFWMYNFIFKPVFSVSGHAVTLKHLTEEEQGVFKSKYLNHWSECTKCTCFFQDNTNTLKTIWIRFVISFSWAHALYKDKEWDIFSWFVLGDKQSEKWGQKPEAEWNCFIPGHGQESQVKQNAVLLF